MSELLYPCASLLLDTRSIQLADGGTFAVVLNAVDNSKGTIANNGQTLTWKNVNMSLVLGSLWEQYSAFNLRLSGYSLATGGNTQSGADMVGVLYMSMSNCNFLNQTYSHFTDTTINETPVSTINFSHGTANSASLAAAQSNLVSFQKPFSSVRTDITLDFRNVRTVNGKTVANPIGQLVFVFDIFPILDSKIKK